MSVDNVIQNMVKYRPEIQNYISNPATKSMLEQEIQATYQKYQHVRKFAEMIDSADKKSAVLKTIFSMNPFGVLGKMLTGILDVPELIVKGAYAAYYSVKTGDYGALPGWALYEGAARVLLPPFGQLLNIRKTYVNRINKNLDKIIAERTVDNFLAKVYTQRKPVYQPAYQPA